MSSTPPPPDPQEPKRRPSGSFPRDPDAQGTDPARKRASGSFPVQGSGNTDPARKRPSGSFPAGEPGPAPPAGGTDPARKRPSGSFPAGEPGPAPPAGGTDPARKRPSGSSPAQDPGPATDPARKRPSGSFPAPADGRGTPGTDPAKRRPTGSHPAPFPIEAGTGQTDPAKRRPSGPHSASFTRPEAPGADAPGPGEPGRGRKPSGSYLRPDAPGGADATDPARRRPTSGGFPRIGKGSSSSFPTLAKEETINAASVPAAPSPPGRGVTGRHRAPVGPREQGEDALVGRLLGGCQVEKLIGRGGMAVVYQARQLDLDREVAVKVLSQRLTQDPRQVDQFAREAKTLARLEHPNIVTVYSFGREEDGACWLVVQLIRGGSLRNVLEEKKRLDPATATSYVVQIAKGLHEAHKAGIIHRDIKPDNILVAPGPVLKITDFGLARMAGDPSQQFGAGEVVGTPHYMSPEQVDAVPDIDGRTDIYALGATFYHLLTGETPFTAPSTLDLLLKHVNEPLQPPHERNKDVPVELSRLVCRMMAKDRADRYASLEDVLRDLEAPGSAGAPAAMKQVELAAPTLLHVDQVPPLRPDVIHAERPRALSFAAVAVVAVLALSIGLGIGPISAVFGEQKDDLLDPREEAAAQALARVEREATGATAERRLELLQQFLAERGETATARPVREQVAKLADELARQRALDARARLAALEKLEAERQLGPALDGLAAMPPPLLETAGDAALKLRGRLQDALRALDVVWMPLGGFTLGEGSKVNQVVLPALYVDRHEVTAARYAAFVAATGARAPAAWGGPAPSAEQALLPVTGVTLREAMAYAAWRKGRVPTFAEWEKAARGPTSQTWPWGEEADPQACNWAGAGLGRLAAPGAFPRDTSPFGCVDLAGNGAELTLGRGSTPEAPRPWVRGGSYATRTLACTRGAFYQELGPDEHHPAVGFRLVYDAAPAPLPEGGGR